MDNKLKVELEKRLYVILKNKNNSSTYSNGELKELNELYRELNKSNHKHIIIPDLIPCVSLISVTSITIAILLKFL
ncbi:hypothetical protein [Staphylococcus pseudoxylosus]|uniref:hypothetical protein n=1 Tax=Staphylococcus pseudoxylosus TaxID=2282419 RepID=UPI002DB94350|nr:hypothetical protein [Staphylococcus pseudoxylosus]MEB7752239.1 hypothetical protein [Staphylococcus pseudoxylosus]